MELVPGIQGKYRDSVAGRLACVVRLSRDEWLFPWAEVS